MEEQGWIRQKKSKPELLITVGTNPVIYGGIWEGMPALPRGWNPVWGGDFRGIYTTFEIVGVHVSRFPIYQSIVLGN